MSRSRLAPRLLVSFSGDHGKVKLENGMGCFADTQASCFTRCHLHTWTKGRSRKSWSHRGSLCSVQWRGLSPGEASEVSTLKFWAHFLQAAPVKARETARDFLVSWSLRVSSIRAHLLSGPLLLSLPCRFPLLSPSHPFSSLSLPEQSK